MNKPKLWTKEFIINAVINFLSALNFYLLMIIVSEYAMTTFGSLPSEAGFAASIFIIGALISRLFTGKYIVHIGYKKMLFIGVAASFIMTLAYFLINSVMLLLVVRFFHGAAFGAATTASATIISDIIPKERRGEGIGYFSLSQIIATAIGPFLGMLLSRHGSYFIIFTACAAAMAISIVIMPFLSLRKTEFSNQQISAKKGFRISDFIEPKAVLISTVCLLIYMCYSSIVSFLSVYAKEINLVDTAGCFFIIYAVFVLLSRPFAGRMFDLKGENIVMYPAIAVFTVGMFLFAVSRNGFMLILSAALIGLGFGAVASSAQTIAVKVTPFHRLGLANSTYFMFCDIGMIFGPLAVGFVIPYIGYRGIYTAAAAVAFVCILFYYLLHGKNAACKTVEDRNN